MRKNPNIGKVIDVKTRTFLDVFVLFTKNVSVHTVD